MREELVRKVFAQIICIISFNVLLNSVAMFFVGIETVVDLMFAS